MIIIIVIIIMMIIIIILMISRKNRYHIYLCCYLIKVTLYKVECKVEN